MVASGEDPYTFFLTPEENKQSKDSLGGKFEGIGAQLGTKDGKIMVIAPIKNSPAIRAGLKAGDFIVAVDGVPTKGKNITQVVTTIRGTAGTTVKITIERKSKEQILSIERAQIQVDNIEIVYKDKIAHVKLQQFGTTVKDEWNTSVETLAAKYRDGEISGMILDMRGNPGGLLDACVHIASDLLPMRALVVKQEGIRDSIEYSVNRLPLLADIPIVVLIDKGSASASEILAGTLRDHKRAQIVGEKSFGKGSVQATYDLSDGSGMHVTIAKWILPKGDWINGKGITPEILVQNPESDVANTVDIEKNDKQLQKAFELLK
jgi:carboxyl-terminal processing protease